MFFKGQFDNFFFFWGAFFKSKIKIKKIEIFRDNKVQKENMKYLINYIYLFCVRFKIFQTNKSCRTFQKKAPEDDFYEILIWLKKKKKRVYLTNRNPNDSPNGKRKNIDFTVYTFSKKLSEIVGPWHTRLTRSWTWGLGLDVCAVRENTQ